jgi:hypothetical protein
MNEKIATQIKALLEANGPINKVQISDDDQSFTEKFYYGDGKYLHAVAQDEQSHFESKAVIFENLQHRIIGLKRTGNRPRKPSG